MKKFMSDFAMRAAFLPSLVFFANHPLPAQCICTEDAELVANTTSFLLGGAVALSGDIAVLGDDWDDCNGGDLNGCGAAYVFRKNGNVWSEEQKLINPVPPQNQSRFGSSVAVFGDRVVIGAISSENSSGENAGAVYIYRFDGTSWNLEQEIFASDGAHGDHFGASVAIDGNVIVVGADRKNHRLVPFAGVSYVFRYDGNSWIEEQKIDAFHRLSDRFGNTVAISGDAIAVGMKAYSSGESGVIFTYRFDGISWVDEQALVPSDWQGGNAGYSVSMSGDVLLTGYKDEALGEGAAYVFRYDGSSWVEEQKLKASDAVAPGSFGASVSVSGDVAAISSDSPNGFPWDPTHDPGVAYVFRFNGTRWVEQKKLVDVNAGQTDGDGSVVVTDGVHVLYGKHTRQSTGVGFIYNLGTPGVLLDIDPEVAAIGDAVTLTACGNPVVGSPTLLFLVGVNGVPLLQRTPIIGQVDANGIWSTSGQILHVPSGVNRVDLRSFTFGLSQQIIASNDATLLLQ